MTQAEAVAWLESKVGVYWDFDGRYQNQCFDSFNFYYQYLTGNNSYSDGYGVEGAKDIWTVDTNLFDKIPDSADFSPAPGDIMIYGDRWGGGFGHVEMCVAVQSDGVWVVGSNFGGNPANPVQKAFRPWWLINTGFIGVLRYKFNGGDDMVKEENLAQIRVIMSEVEGWNGHEVHAGKHDAQILGWVGKTWVEFIQHCWDVQPRHRVYIEEDVTNLTKQLTDVKTALANEQSKPPKEVVKEVEKIVTEYVDRPVEVIKEVNPSWLEAIIQLIRKVLKIK